MGLVSQKLTFSNDNAVQEIRATTKGVEMKYTTLQGEMFLQLTPEQVECIAEMYRDWWTRWKGTYVGYPDPKYLG